MCFVQRTTTYYFSLIETLFHMPDQFLMFYYFSSFPIFCIASFKIEIHSIYFVKSKENTMIHYEKISRKIETIECETANPEMEMHCNYHML